MIIAMNGALCASDKAVISVYDHGFLYGMGVFETFRTYNGHPFLLAAHLERLAAAARELGIPYETDEARLAALVQELLQANGLEDAYFRLSVSAGEEPLGLPGDTYSRPAEILYVKPLPPERDAAVWAAGRPLQLLETRRNTPEGERRLKSFHYMNSIFGKRELSRYSWAQGAEGLFLDDCGFVSEGTVSNLFFIQGDTLYTPAAETCILEGITREWVLRHASEAGMEVEDEGFYTWEMLLEADEIFLTNSIQEIMPVTSLYDPEGNGLVIGGGAAGDRTRQLALHYRQAAEAGGNT
ncbi:MAG: 4-amino-4-deoxychorismate lyase [Paenibacillaceae bacterium]|jgi:4-amino-4-deoxychorismate lyase|nr:4-amino-4-deoxychorismate lyase [Paenibacillaceae bacterium]